MPQTLTPLRHRVGVSVTLALYVGRSFTWVVIAMVLALTGLVSLFDFIDLLRRVSTKPDVPTSLVFEIAGLHIPYFMILIMPFGILLGGIVCFWRLTRSSELIVARAAGISAWQFLAAPVASALLIGGLGTMAISPLSSFMFRQAEFLDQTYLQTGGGPLTFNGTALWLREAEPKKGVAIIHAENVHREGGALRLGTVSIFRLNNKDHLTERLTASSGRLVRGFWELNGVSSVRPNHLPYLIGDMKIPTSLTLGRVEQSFASPDTLSIWALPRFVRLLQASGFSTIRHRLHFQTLLALPILCGTMALVSAGFSMRPTRRGGVARMLGSGVAAGFALFSVSKIAAQFGESGALPPLLAAWAPTMAGLCLAVALLLHLEDG